MTAVTFGVLCLVGAMSILHCTWAAVAPSTGHKQGDGGAQSILVNLYGSDHPTCGIKEPCKSIQYVLDKHLLQDKGTILLTGKSSHEGNEQFLECVDWTFNTSISFTIKGNDPAAYMGCHGDRALRTYLTFIGSHRNLSVTFHDISLNQVSITAIDVSFIVKHCTFSDSTMEAQALHAIPINPELSDVTWLGLADCSDDYKCMPTGSVVFEGFIGELLIQDSTFLHTKVMIRLRYDALIQLSRNTFSDRPSERAVQAGVFISLGLTSQNTSVKVNDCVFENQYHWNPVDSVSNIFMSSLLIRLLPPAGYQVAPNEVDIHIHNTTFTNNERALTFQGLLENILITDSTFINNIAMHAGAGILLLLYTSTPVHVTNCTFHSNAAGFFRTEHVRPPGSYFSIRGDEAMVTSKCCKGSVSMIGKGGALRVQKGNMILEETSFHNNSARILGGTIFVDRDSEIQILNCTFSNSEQIDTASQQGDIIFSNGKVRISGGHLIVKSASNHISLLRHSGVHWSIAVYDINIECPIGHRLRVMNTSAFRIEPHIGLQKSYMLDQLSYFCESCPRHRYSTDRGSLKYKLNEGVYHYFSLMINGESPNSDFAGNYTYNDISCKDCPYGGNCDSSIRSLPNFWGYEREGRITFQQCPKGYCCSSTNCPTFNGCASHRTGVMCSGCEIGYSEALFSSKCIPDIECGPVWIWPFAAGMGLLYMLFLFFQKDVRDFIFTRPSECDDMSCCLCKPKLEETEYSMCERNPDGTESYENNVASGSAETLAQREVETFANDKTEDLEEKVHQNGDITEIKKPRTDITEAADQQSTAESEKVEGKEGEAPQPANRDMGAIYLIIIMYYFQDAQLFNIKTASAVPDNKFHANLRTVLLGLFKFRLEVAHFVDNVCLLPGLSASEKLLAKTLLVPYTLILFGVLYIIYMCISSLRKNTEENLKNKEVFLSRLCTGFMLALMFTYQRLATTTFKLLNCVPVGDDSVLFIDGSVKCYTMWQYGVIAYAICCIVPFCGVLILGPSLLKEGRISLPTFFTACLIPLPFVVYWSFKRISSSDCCMKRSDEESPHRNVVLKVLQGPFKDLVSNFLGPFCWAGVLIARRLVLVVLFTFINHSLIRIIAMLLVCFIILLHHVHIQPYKDVKVNIAGSVSVSALMIVGGINLVRAGFEVAEYVPMGPNERLMWFMKNTENVMMLWFPAAIMGLVFLGLVVKIFFIIVFSCRHRA